MDCMEAMKEIPDKYFELAIVDPPYGIGIAEWDNQTTKPTKEYFDELFRISQNQIIWGGNYFNLPHSEGWICWDKTYRYNQKFSIGEFELAWTSLPIKHTFIRYTSCGNFQGFSHPRANYKKGKNIHPTQKPVALYKWLLKNYAKEGDKILDTHMGSGSSIIACIDYGFDYMAFEIDKDYFNSAEARIEAHKKKNKMKLIPDTEVVEIKKKIRRLL